MALKAILFDWFNTLARYDPPREELQSEALSEFGVQVSANQLIPAILLADKYLFQEYAKARIDSRTPEEKAKVFIRYEEIMLTAAGIKFDKDLPEKIYSKSKHLFGRGTIDFALFDDVLPVLKTLDEKGYVLGLITNFVRNMPSFVSNLGLDPYLDFIITPQDAGGADKPNPAIFLAALERAKAKPGEALFIGDQYQIDIVGARNVGMSPVLIDRFNIYPEVTDCPRIKDLYELEGFLNKL